MAPIAPNLWRRPCYSNSRLLQLPRHRWVRLRWRRLPLPPGAVIRVGTTVDGTAAGAVPASSSAGRPIMVLVTAAAMCGDWSQRRGASLAPGESLLLIQTVSTRGQKPRRRRAGAFHYGSTNGTAPRVHSIFTGTVCNRSMTGNIFRPGDLVLRRLIEMETRCGTRHE
jgi:hypothetical protein